MRFCFLFLILLLNIKVMLSQQVTITVHHSNEKAVALSSLSGENISFIDSVRALNDGEFKFNLGNRHSGIYRLTFNNKTRLDFIYDNENVNIETDANNILDSLKVINSESNKIYHAFIKLNKAYKTKSELLQLILARYPKGDGYYQATKEKLLQVQKDYIHFVNVTSQANPNSFIARYVRSAQLPIVDVNIPPDEQLIYLKTHALDNVNFNDDDLTYSDAFTNKTIEYLTYYRNPQLPMGLLEKEFEAAIDTILGKAKINELVYKHIVEYLLDGFKKFGFDNVINYIVDNYVIKDDLCLDEKLGNTIERRIQQARNFKIGYSVPDIVLPDKSGKLIDLNKIKADSVLIIFYASWCPHCKALLPKVYDLYKHKKRKGFEVLAVSIDTSKTDWVNFIRENNFDWLNVSDLEGWIGQATLDYFIYATPTMFLVNNQKKLIRIPRNFEEIK